jgi:hypothetical protein
VRLLDELADASGRRARIVPILLLGLGTSLAASLIAGGSYFASIPSSLQVQLADLFWVGLTLACVTTLLTTSKTVVAVEARRRNTSVRLLGLGLVGAQILSSAVNGGWLSPQVFLPMALGIALVTRYPIQGSDVALRCVQIATMIPVLASVGAFAAGLSYAQTVEDRRLPGLFVDGRLTGVLPHPNALAPVAAVALVVTVARRGRCGAPIRER